MTRSYNRPDDLGLLLLWALGTGFAVLFAAVGIAIFAGGPGI